MRTAVWLPVALPSLFSCRVRMAVVQNGFCYRFPTQASFSGTQTSKPCPHCPLVDSSVQGSLSLVEKWSPLKANAAPSWLSREAARSYMEGFNLGTAEQAPLDPKS